MAMICDLRAIRFGQVLHDPKADTLAATLVDRAVPTAAGARHSPIDNTRSATHPKHARSITPAKAHGPRMNPSARGLWRSGSPSLLLLVEDQPDLGQRIFQVRPGGRVLHLRERVA